jgi:rod shape-determining protein MreC
MNQLLAFIIRQRGFIVFVMLEVVSLWAFFKFNNYPSVVFFNTANVYAGRLLAIQTSFTEYGRLGTVNADLAAENARLNALVAKLQNQQLSGTINYQADSAVASRFQPIVAKVISNSTSLANNYLTIDQGTADGIQPGMGVISPTGVVGKVQVCSEHFSRVTSILHTEPAFLVSSRVKRSGEIGFARWQGANPDRVKFNDVSRYKSVQVGDTIVTSDLNSVFPPGIFVGFVRKLGITPDQAFWDVELKTATDFRNVSYVYVIKNALQAEQNALENPAPPAKK